MSENSRLRIHTQIIPGNAPEETQKKVRWRCIPHPAKNRERRKPDLKDRLLRNSALACALLLGILAMGNINQPWARQASETIEQALTMHIDLDESIGQLSFVKKLMPDSALVFLNFSGKSELAKPVPGEITHGYTQAQPWLMYSCPKESVVCSAANGTVTAISELSGGVLGVLIDHGEGVETVYAYLSEACVSPGDSVSREDAIGLSTDMLYFEYREGGSPADPTGKLGE